MNVKIVLPPHTYFDSASIQIGHMISILQEECAINTVNYIDYKSEQFYLVNRLISSVIDQYWEELMEHPIQHLLKDEARALVFRAIFERIMGVKKGTEHIFKLNESLLDELERVYRKALESLLNRMRVSAADSIVFVLPHNLIESTCCLALMAKQKDPHLCTMVFDYYNLHPGTPHLTAFLSNTNFWGDNVSQQLQLDPLYPVLNQKIPHILDYIVVGEGYDVLRLMFQSYKKSAIPPSLKYPQKCCTGEVLTPHSSPDSVTVVTSSEVALDSLPMPDYSEMRTVYTKGQIELTRGCPYQCLFCETSAALSFRKHSIPYFLELLEHVTRYNFEHLCFWDPALNTDCEHTKKALKEVKNNVTFQYTAQLRAHPADPDVIALLHETGCDLAGIGMESASQRIIDDMRKQYTVASLEELVQVLGKNDIVALLYTLIAYPTEQLKDVKKTISFIQKAAGFCSVDITLEPYGVGQVQRLSLPHYKKFGIEWVKPSLKTVEKATVLHTRPGLYMAVRYKRGMTKKEYHAGLQSYRELADNLNLKGIIPG